MLAVYSSLFTSGFYEILEYVSLVVSEICTVPEVVMLPGTVVVDLCLVGQETAGTIMARAKFDFNLDPLNAGGCFGT